MEGGTSETTACLPIAAPAPPICTSATRAKAASETESRLLNGLRKTCPALPVNLGLKETLAAMRRGQGIPVGKKVVIVLDQFEQWLHAKKQEENAELVQALRQCDGGRVQCIVMVRDDFWMAIIRFMRELEDGSLEGRRLRDRLLESSTPDVPGIIKEMKP